MSQVIEGIIIKCPSCGTELPIKPTKEWNFKNNYYHVKSYKCPKCNKHTMEYYHDGKHIFTIPKKGWKA